LIESENGKGEMSNDHPQDILERLEDYSVGAVGLFRYLQEKPDRACWDLGRQELRAATSIGANTEESQDASSKKDFIYTYSIALREARESRFFLRLFIRVELAPEDLYYLIRYTPNH